MRSKPTYFDAVQSYAASEWDKLESSSWGRAVHHLFSQVQSPQHVISELLQNADDAGATWARMRCHQDHFIFEHNGDDFTAEQFKSLCSFGVSAKSRLLTIGFRGIGFKSTFSFGSRVALITPSLAATFAKERFTIPGWIEGFPPTQHTTIQIRLEDDIKARRAQIEQERWAENPTPLLFFRNLRQLIIEDEKILARELGPGPVAGSREVRIEGRSQHELIHIASGEEDFPREALEEIRQERGVGDIAELGIRSCQVELIIGDPQTPSVYVVLPMEFHPNLAFSVNAPFIQTPDRTRPKSPSQSPTNRWLLQRAGALAAESMRTWLRTETMPLSDRAEAYQLLSQRPDSDGDLEDEVCQTVMDAFWRTLADNPILLSSSGELVQERETLAVAPSISEVWEPSTTLEVLGSHERHLLAGDVSTAHRRRLKAWDQLIEIDRDAVFLRLAQRELVPRPSSSKQLLKLWAFLEPAVRQRRYYRNDPLQAVTRLPVIPAHGQDMLWSAESVAVIGEYQPQLRPDELEFFMRYLVALDSSWISAMTQADDKAMTGVVRLMLSNLGLDHPISAGELVRRTAQQIFGREQPGADGVRLAQIAARSNIRVDPTFKFKCLDGQWRAADRGLIAGSDGATEALLPDAWIQAHRISDDYNSSLEFSERRHWLLWLSDATPVQRFPHPHRTSRRIHGWLRIRRFCEERGGGNSLNAPLKSTSFQVDDFDFSAELWEHWEQRVESHDGVWVDLVRALSEELSLSDLKRLDEASISQWGTKHKRAVEHGPLLPAWIQRLRLLPCLPDEYSKPSLPSELLRVTSQTAFLQKIDRFVHPELDVPGNVVLLDLLGVRSDPTTTDVPLQRLRALSGVEQAPIHQLAGLYETVDRIAARQDSEQLAELRSAFDTEPLIITGDGRWATTDTVVQETTEDLPGVMTIHPDIHYLGLTLWDRIGVARQPDPEQLLLWLTEHETGARPRPETRGLIVSLLRTYAERIWRGANAWLSADGVWSSRDDLSWWIAERGTANALFSRIRRAVADCSMLHDDFDIAGLMSSMPPLGEVLESRLEGTGAPRPDDQPEWLEPLGRGLAILAQQRLAGDEAEGAAAESVAEPPDADIAARLIGAAWYELQRLEVTPYIDDEPAGEARVQRAIWNDAGLYVAGTSAQYHDDLIRALRARFVGRFAQEAISACVGRSQGWIREYFVSRFDIDPDTIDEIDTPERHGGRNNEEHSRPNVTFTVVGPDDEAELDNEDDSTTEYREVATAGRGRQNPRWRRLLVAHILDHGFAPVLGGDDRDAFRHPDGRTFTIQRAPFHGVERSLNSQPIGHYWVGDKPLEEGFEIAADVWSMLIEQSTAGWIILPAGHDQVASYRAEELRIIADLFPARYRVRLREGVDPWSVDVEHETDDAQGWVADLTDEIEIDEPGASDASNDDAVAGSTARDRASWHSSTTDDTGWPRSPQDDTASGSSRDRFRRFSSRIADTLRSNDEFV